jgi:predicted metal-dependent phosphotriesterase family hydrolase
MAADGKMIQTVKGLIPASELGYCQSHEHLFIAGGRSAELVPSLRLDDPEKTSQELASYRRLGGMSIVDAQPVGCGRMAGQLYDASIRTGVNIISSTGFHKLVFYPEDHWIRTMDETALLELFTGEMESGMFIGCDASLPSRRIPSKAGLIKTASDTWGPSGEYTRYFEAAAEASRLTGRPIMSHTEMGKGALEQIDLFTGRGVPVDSIIICHLDRVLTDMDYLLSVARTGVYMEFDTIGRFKYHSDEDEARFILKLIEEGCEDRILIGLDTTRERMKSYGGSLGLDYILTSFIPLLKSFGIADSIIDKFTTGNPAKAFSIKNHNQEGK